MTVGVLEATVRLENPVKYYQGWQESIPCYVELMYRPHKWKKKEEIPELFGPLTIRAVLQGRSKSVIWRDDNEWGGQYYSCDIPLFQQCDVVFQDSFRSQSGETHRIPFQICFPELDNASVPSGLKPHVSFATQTGLRDYLPSSFQCSGSGFFCNFSAEIDYRLSVIVELPGLPIEIKNPHWDDHQVVNYVRAPLETSMDDQRHSIPSSDPIYIHNAQLLPEYERPHGFREKAHSMFHHHSLPHFAFDWLLVAPHKIYIGQAISFAICIRNRRNESTVVEIPEVQLKIIHVRIRSQAFVRTEPGFLSQPETDGEVGDAQLAAEPIDDTPFSDENDWTKEVLTAPLSGVTNSFQFHNVALSHTMEIKVRFMVAGEEKSHHLTCDAVVYPLQNDLPLSAPTWIAPNAPGLETNDGTGDGTPQGPPYQDPYGNPVDQSAGQQHMPNYNFGAQSTGFY